jgi:aminodeoxyfutalosine deaminase
MNVPAPWPASRQPGKSGESSSRVQSEQPWGGLPVLHRAKWVVPVAYPPIENAAVLVKNGMILAAGPFSQVKAASPANAVHVDHGSSAIVPGLVNAHTHLELSAVGDSMSLPKESFAKWLEELLFLRPTMNSGLMQEGLLTGQRRLAATGCCLCGDITNGACLQTGALGCHDAATPGDEQPSSDSRITTKESPPGTQHPGLRTQDSTFITHHSFPSTHSFPVRQVFLEILGFDRGSLDEALGGDLAQALGVPPATGLPFSLAAHACYSTSGPAISDAKEWCRAKGLRFSIHAAEHSEEIDFLERGTGFCREILEKLGRWTPNWTPPETTPVHYLEQLQVLDSNTILVHAVHLTDADWEIVTRKRCPICFCPRSNRNLNVGQPDIAKALRSGLVAALGTDSLASNTDLSIFAEAAYILEGYSDVHPQAILSMMTWGGARALGQERHFGSIEPGRAANLLIISGSESYASHRLFETIIQQGNKGAWRWAHHPANDCV